MRKIIAFFAALLLLLPAAAAKDTAKAVSILPTLTMDAYTTQRFTVTLTGMDTDTPIRWKAWNPAVATVSSDGVITALKAGQCHITAQADGCTAVCLVTVLPMERLYSGDGRVIEVRTDRVAAYLQKGWYRQPRPLLFAEQGGSGSLRWRFGSGLLLLEGSGTVTADSVGKPAASSLYLTRGITAVAGGSFAGFSALTRAEVSDTVRYLGAKAFHGTALTRIGIPASVTSIRDDAFLGCKNLTVYAPAGSAAHAAAQAQGLAFAEAEPVYHPDGRTCMVTAKEKPAFLRGGWYDQPVTRLYATDGRELVCTEKNEAGCKASGWKEYEEVYTTMYALDGRTAQILNTRVPAFRRVGWYTYGDYIAAKARSIRSTQGCSAAIAFVEKADPNPTGRQDHSADFAAVIRELCGIWASMIKAPVAAQAWRVDRSGAVPAACITLRNLSDKTVTGVELMFTCVDKNGRVTTSSAFSGGNVEANAHGLTMAAASARDFSWHLYSHGDTHSIRSISLRAVTYADGTRWTP